MPAVKAITPETTTADKTRFIAVETLGLADTGFR